LLANGNLFIFFLRLNFVWKNNASQHFARTLLPCFICSQLEIATAEQTDGLPLLDNHITKGNTQTKSKSGATLLGETKFVIFPILSLFF
jgi:hypothetical protein